MHYLRKRLILVAMSLLVLGLAWAPMSQAQEDKEKIAVLDFDVIGSTREQGAVLTNQLRSELLKTGRYTMVNRSQLDKILDEQALQQQVCIEAECAVKVGRVLGVRRIVTGSVTKVTDTLWQISTTLTNVETAEILRQEVVNHAGDFASLFLSGMASVAKKLAATEDELIAGATRLTPESIAPAIFDVLKSVQAGPLAFSHDSARLYFATGNKVVLWNIQGRAKVGEALEVPKGKISALAINRDGSLLVAGTDRGYVSLLEIGSRRVIHTSDTHSGPVLTVAFSPANNYFASGGEDEKIHVYHVRTGEPAYELDGPDDEVAAVRFSSDGKFLIGASRDRTIRLFDVNVQKEVRAFKESAKKLLHAEISGDGAYLGIAAKVVKIDLRRNRRLDTELIKIRDVKTGEELLSFEAHEKDITGLAFFPDPRYLATASKAGSIKIWDLQSNAEISSLSVKAAVGSLRVSPNGKWIAASDDGGSVTLWEVTR